MTSPRRPGQWRWVAHPPWRPPVQGTRPPPPRHRTGPAWADRTPAYPATPRWGLPLVAIPHRVEQSGSPRRARVAGAAPGIVGAAATWFAAAAVAHGLRYAVLVWYADRLAPWWVEAVTAAIVWVAGVVAIAVGIAAAVAATAWLVEARRRVYSPAPDPRRRAGLWIGCLLPVVNWFRIPVYLEELRQASPRSPDRSELRRWWLAVAVNGAAVALALWRGTGEGPQAAADTVLLTALAALAAVWAARETRTVMRCFDEPSPRFTHRLLPRGIVNTSPARKE
ncbi:DUF4328 domain-containing protein [Dietzia sp. PP-33]|uniref:DUF4328 domain-containing protein n=1 Tax=Dietzia sp. PP-33 TaxID=2957500 RepID=UPI0029AF9B70|nr:DUF4328 domain-containing protein [Dietzia sp. PP-33]MDX2357857.1 DUF4328 domain-containing protein [Dietzia sp. PP-33]